MSIKKIQRLVVASTFVLFTAPAMASTFQLDFDTDFSDPSDPDSAPPSGSNWLTAVFDDGDTFGSATLTLTVGNIGDADVINPNRIFAGRTGTILHIAPFKSMNAWRYSV